MSFDESKRRALSVELKGFCVFAKDHDFIEVTEWSNGEGYDITITGKQQFSLSYGELQAITYLTNAPK